MLENLHQGGAVRKGGAIVPVPSGWKTRTIDFGRGPRLATTIPWGDVSTAFHSTGIPDIEVYLAVPRGAHLAMVASRAFGWLLGSPWVRGVLQRRIDAQPAGPDAAGRAQGRSLLWGEVRDAAGQVRVSRLRGPEGYTLTALASLHIVAKVLAGNAPVGFQTPAKAYGPDLALELDGVERTDD